MVRIGSKVLILTELRRCLPCTFLSGAVGGVRWQTAFSETQLELRLEHSNFIHHWESDWGRYLAMCHSSIPPGAICGLLNSPGTKTPAPQQMARGLIGLVTAAAMQLVPPPWPPVGHGRGPPTPSAGSPRRARRAAVHLQVGPLPLTYAENNIFSTSTSHKRFGGIYFGST